MNMPLERLASHADSEIEVVANVRSFVVRALGRDVLDAEDFFATGMVSSLFGMQLIAFIENSFSVEVTDEDLILDNFRSIENISRFVARKTVLR